MAYEHVTNMEKLTRVVDFSGLKVGKVRPSDIDGSIEMNDKVFITLEFKEGARSMDKGQFLLLQRYNRLQHEALQARAFSIAYAQWQAKGAEGTPPEFDSIVPEDYGMLSITLVCEHPDTPNPDGATSTVRGAFHEGVYKPYGNQKTLVEVLQLLGARLKNNRLENIGK